MTLLKFLGYLTLGFFKLFSPLLIIPLVVVWMVLSVIVSLMNLWYKAAGSPKYREHGFDEFSR